MTNEIDNAINRNKGGRPRRCDGPKANYIEIDRLLVMGELIDNGKGKEPEVVYPSYRDLANRFNVSNSVIADYAKKHDCLRRRKRAHERLMAKTEEKLLEMRAEAIAFSKEDALATIDSFLLKFREAIGEGRVRADSPADFNMLLRLKEFILGGADSRAEIHAALSLEDLQARHRQMLKTAEENSDAERGLVGSHAQKRSSNEATELEVPPLLHPATLEVEPSARFSDAATNGPINEQATLPVGSTITVGSTVMVGLPEATVTLHDGPGIAFEESQGACCNGLAPPIDCHLTSKLDADGNEINEINDDETEN